MKAIVRACSALALGACVALASERALADETDALPPVPAPTLGRARATDASSKPPLVWRWSRFSTAEYVITGAAGLITLGAAIIQPRPQHTLEGGLWFDEAVRNAIRPNDMQTRYVYRDVSDVGVSLAVTWPFFADSLVSAWWYRNSRDVAEQMALIDLEAMAVSGAVQGATNVWVSRERPYGRSCGSPELPDRALDCEGSTHYRSFFSGHTTFSFTGAALVCVHHLEHDLLGAPWDAVSCGAGYVLAAATGASRVLGDVHYTTDVLTGALVGTVVGYGVPLLHYAFPSSTLHAGTVSMHIVPTGTGATMVGVF